MRTINDNRPVVMDIDDIEDGQYKETPKTEADVALEDFLDKAKAMGSGAQLRINKLSGGINSAEQFCASYPVDKYDYFDLLEVVQKTWGAGDYRIYCTVKGKKGILQNKLVSIAAPPLSLMISQAGGAPDSASQIMAQMAQMIRESNERLMEALKPKESDGDRMKFMQEMLMMKQIFGGDDKKSPSMLAGVKEMVEVMTMMQGLSGGGQTESEPMWMKALSAFAPVAVAAVSAAAQPKPQRQIAPHPHPHQMSHPMPKAEVIKPVNEPIEHPPQEKNPMSDKAEAIGQIIMALNAMGTSALKPEDIAEKICSIPDEQIEPLIAWVEKPTCYDDLVAVNPEVEKFKEWFLDLIEHVRGQLGLDSKYADLYYDEEETSEPPLNESKPD